MCSPSRITVAMRRDPDALVPVLDSLPPCFRTGAGWLVSGGQTHGASLGARLVWDSNKTEDSPEAEATLKRGKAARGIWTWMEQQPAISAAIAGIADVPVWSWTEEAWRLLDSAIGRYPVHRRTLTDLLRSVKTDQPLVSSQATSDYYSYL
jgi:hypothetical protein